jgi:hypothetical protein
MGFALTLATIALAAGNPQPRLFLSISSGKPGTRVDVVGRDCPKPVGERDTLAWHDHYGFLHDTHKQPPLGVWRRVSVIRTSAASVRAVFVVPRWAHAGRGLLDLVCGGRANATAWFSVAR